MKTVQQNIRNYEIEQRSTTNTSDLDSSIISGPLLYKEKNRILPEVTNPFLMSIFGKQNRQLVDNHATQCLPSSELRPSGLQFHDTSKIDLP